MEEYKIWEKENLKKIKNLIKDEKILIELKEFFKSSFNCGYNTGYVGKEKEAAKKNWENWNQK
jgi:hypothetical protein